MATGKSVPRRDGAARLSLRLVLGFYGAMGAAALAWRLVVDRTIPWAEGPDHAPPIHWMARAAAGLAAGAALVVVSRVWTARSAAGRTLADELGRLLGPLGAGRAAVLAALSGLAEEAFFRGALQPRVGWLAATLLFAAAHFVPARRLWSWSLFALLAGAVFGALFAWSGDLLAPFLAHALVNAVNLRWLARRER